MRTELVETLVKLAGDVPAARAALGLSPRQDDEIARNAALWTGATLPALHRYTGVLYDALDVGSMTRAQRARAGRRLAVGSALFGLVRADDRIPAYRLSAGSALPGPAHAALALAAGARPRARPGSTGLVVDLRSGSYAALAPVPGAVTVQVLSERPGRHARGGQPLQQGAQGPRSPGCWPPRPREPADVVRLRSLLRRAGLHVEHDGGTALTLVVPAP